MSGTDTPYSAICLRACYAMSGTDIGYAATACLALYEAPTRCPVLMVGYAPTRGGGGNASPVPSSGYGPTHMLRGHVAARRECGWEGGRGGWARGGGGGRDGDGGRAVVWRG
eukprot:353395-Rhodomonas_salina.1